MNENPLLDGRYAISKERVQLVAAVLTIGLVGCGNVATGPTSRGSSTAHEANVSLLPPMAIVSTWPPPDWAVVSPQSFDSQPADCVGLQPRSAQQWGVERDSAGQVRPILLGDRVPHQDALPTHPSLRLIDKDEGSATARYVIPQVDGWLVAMDSGEFGGGLFWIARDTEAVEIGNAGNSDPIRWIGSVNGGIVGISGLCHGEHCGSTSVVHRVERDPSGVWNLTESVRLSGCPAARVVEKGTGALLVAGCGVLQRVIDNHVQIVAKWPLELMVDGSDRSIAQDSTGAYYVSFGYRIARFSRETQPQWFAPKACTKLTRQQDGSCSCGP